jgi:hypothetical protein
LDISAIVVQLKSERNRIDEAIKALDGGSANGNRAVARKGGMSAAGRKRISEMMKKRWAERRKKAKPKN